MKRLGRHLWRVALAAFSVLAVVACSSSAGTIQCGACPGDYLDPNGLIGPDDQVASIRVCTDIVCRTEHSTDIQRDHRWYVSMIGTHPPDRHRIERIEVTTLDARNKVIRVETATSIDLPAARAKKGPCACSGLQFAYDNAAGRLVVTSQ